MYLQHELQTIIYSISKYLLQKYSSLPPPWRLNGAPLMTSLSIILANKDTT